ncbi:MAG: SLC13 family permease [Ignavibacteria bacterium]|jgi:di/tricarboxylate transporter|nr:SLC13 family permease [Ignavibacteria bacterium]
MLATLIILLVTAVLLVWGKIRSDIIALCSLLALVLTNVLTPAEALAGFSNPVVIMIAALFVVGGAITKTGLAEVVSNRLLKLAGDSNYKLFILVILVTALIGTFLSNTGTVAMLMPIVVSMAAKSKANVSRLLMPMAYASSIGGMMTLIGTPPTLIMHNTLIEAGYEGLQFFTTLPVGLILLFFGILLLWPLTKMLDKKGKRDQADGETTVKSPEQLANDYNVIDNLYRVVVQKGSPIVGKKLADIDITKCYSLIISEIRIRMISSISRSARSFIPEASTVLAENNVLYIIGDFKDVLRFVKEKNLAFLDSQIDKQVERPKFGGKFKFNEIGMAEVVILKNSRLHNRTVRESEFRSNYNVSILGIQRNDRHIIQDIKDVKMQSGDMLLVQGTWEDIDRLSRLENEIVVIGQPETEASKITLNHKAPYAAIILLLMVLAMVFNWFPPVIAVLLAAVFMVLGGCFRTVRDAYRTINWESVVLFAGMMPLATAMEKTGTSALVTNSIVDMVGSFGPYAVLAGIMLATSTLTMFISNTATAILFAPIGLQAALSTGVSPYPFLIGVAVAASMCLASPFSTPPNAMVMSAGKYNFMDYIKVGLPLQLFFLVLMILFLPIIFPF